MPCTSRAVGSYVASEISISLWGQKLPPGRPGVLVFQGAQGTADKCWLTGTADSRGVHHVLAQTFPCFSGDLGQTTSTGVWGNDTGRTRVGQLKTWAQDSTKVPVPATAGAMYIFCGSGGMLQALNYARANAASVRAIAGAIPLTHLDAFHDSAGGASSVSDIETAYGGSAAYEAALATHDPIATGNQAALSTVPIKMWYSPDDPLVDPTWPPAYATAVNAAGGSATATAMTTGGGHSYTMLNPSEVVDFFLAH